MRGACVYRGKHGDGLQPWVISTLSYMILLLDYISRVMQAIRDVIRRYDDEPCSCVYYNVRHIFYL